MLLATTAALLSHLFSDPDLVIETQISRARGHLEAIWSNLFTLQVGKRSKICDLSHKYHEILGWKRILGTTWLCPFIFVKPEE